MKLTPQIQNSLGDAILLLDGDALYAVNKSWLLVLSRAEQWLSTEAITWLQQQQQRNSQYFVNWKVITAKEVDLEAGMYLPGQHRKFESLFVDRYSHSSSFVGVTEVREMLDTNLRGSLYGEGLVDLSAMFRDGKVRAHYESKADEAGSFAKRENATSYAFRFDDKVIPVDGSFVRAFHDLGMTLISPSLPTGDRRPDIGLQHSENPGAIFGFVAPLRGAGILEDKLGRKLFEDAALVCWTDEASCLKAMGKSDNYPLPASSLWERLEDSYGAAELRGTVGSLRWKGWADEDIEKAYESRRLDAWHALHLNLQKQVEGYMQEMSGDLNAWRTRHVETGLQRICNAYEVLQPTLGVELGGLPEAVALLDILLATQEPLAMGA